MAGEELNYLANSERHFLSFKRNLPLYDYLFIKNITLQFHSSQLLFFFFRICVFSYQILLTHCVGLKIGEILQQKKSNLIPKYQIDREKIISRSENSSDFSRYAK